MDSEFTQTQANGSVQVQPKPDNYLVWSILTTICCCLPFGIVAIVYSSKVNTLYNSQQYSAAVEAANNAKKWCLISLITGIAIDIIYFAIMFFTGAFATMCNM